MISRFFTKMASKSAHVMGSWQAFAISGIGCIIWMVLGPVFAFSDTWQLWINTITTVLTFLAVFLIQNVQNRDDEMMKQKLDMILEKLEEGDLTDQ